MESKHSKFITGALVGLGLGLLIAPIEGSEAKKELKSSLNKRIKETCLELEQIAQDNKSKKVEEAALEVQQKIDNILEELDKPEKKVEPKKKTVAKKTTVKKSSKKKKSK